jgi:hypothetical protein
VVGHRFTVNLDPHIPARVAQVKHGSILVSPPAREVVTILPDNGFDFFGHYPFYVLIKENLGDQREQRAKQKREDKNFKEVIQNSRIARNYQIAQGYYANEQSAQQRRPEPFINTIFHRPQSSYILPCFKILCQALGLRATQQLWQYPSWSLHGVPV